MNYINWVNSFWRPAAAITYLIINIFDFIVAPVFFAWWSYFTQTSMGQWTPLTLQGGGVFHISFGAIITMTSFGRTKEKLAQAINDDK